MRILHVITSAAALVLGGAGMAQPLFAQAVQAQAAPVAASALSADPASAVKAPHGQGRPILLISIYGLSPDSLFQADSLGLKIPTLRQLMRDGATARRVLNVNPTVTNPNHTTMVTGVSPAAHGVLNNRPFGPAARLPTGYRDYQTIQVPTLWSLAKDAGKRTASLYWPVTRNADDIDFNIVDGPSGDDGHITQQALALIAQERPDLMTVHYVSHDSAQHKFGPQTPEAFASLERIDGEIGTLIAAFQAHYDAPIIAVASDHGFFRIEHRVHLNSAFVDAGLIDLDESAASGVRDWRAFAWYVGGMAMVVLKDPADAQVRAEVEAFLDTLAQRDEAGIARIYRPEEIADKGLSPQAQYVIALKKGYHMGNEMTGPLRTTYSGGAHGAFTGEKLREEMHSAFILQGEGIAAGQDLGLMDLRQLAPTLAHYMGVDLQGAEKPPLTIRP